MLRRSLWHYAFVDILADLMMPPSRDKGDAPNSAEPSWSILTDADFAELLRLSRMYRREARRAASAKAYLAACIMIGSTVETALVCLVHLYWADIPPNAQLPSRHGKTRHVLDWSLADLSRIAVLAGWLPANADDWNSKEARIGDWIRWVHRVRNLVHPARYLADHPRRRITEGYARTAFDVLSISSEWFVARVAKSIEDKDV